MPQVSELVVTVDNFARAETHNYFRNNAIPAGGTGKFVHIRKPVDVTKQPVIRMNRDTLYSSAIFDLDSPVTIHMPDSGDRFLSMMVINEGHYIKYMTYTAGDHTLTQPEMGSRYVMMVVRTFVDPDSAEDIAAVNALQDKFSATQKAAGTLELPEWDKKSLDGCRAALLALGAYIPNSSRCFGNEAEVDPVRHLIYTASGWGGNRTEDAMYFARGVEANDGATPHVLHLRDVPVDGFWSLTVYNARGYLEPNPYNAYSLNGSTARHNADGSTTVRFGGDPGADNFLYIMPGWNYALRLYRPRREAVEGDWVAPEPVPA